MALFVGSFLVWSADAKAGYIHSEAESTTVEGAQSSSFVISTRSGTIHCSSLTVSGSFAAKTTSELEYAPSFSGCTSTGFVEAGVTLDPGVKFRVTWAGVLPLEDIIGTLKITAPFCTITIEAQLLSGVSFTNTGSGTTREIHISLNDSSVTYSQSGFGCRDFSGTYFDGLFSGTIRFTGKSGGSHRGIWAD